MRVIVRERGQKSEYPKQGTGHTRTGSINAIKACTDIGMNTNYGLGTHDSVNAERQVRAYGDICARLCGKHE